MVKKFIIILLFFFVLFSLHRIYEKGKRIKHLQDVKQSMVQEQREKERGIVEVEKKMHLPIDRHALEKIGHEQLHFSRGNETVVIFKDE
ncbi:MAG: hypothetical protein U9N18_06255 [Campylobacterota bacterium]|nr:hypothetical protein [Campylobacterota bacterium]